MTELDPEIAQMLRREGARVDDVPADAAARLAERLALSMAAAPAAAAAAGGAAAFASKVLPFVITLVVGAGIGAFVVDAVKTSKPTIVYVDRSTPSAVSSPAAPAATPSMATVSVDTLPSAAAAPSSARVAPEDTLIAERKVLDAARKALGSGDHAAAMRALDEHTKVHANGRLVEEREALRVRTLADSGRLDEARTVATRFRARWPESVLLPAVEAAIAPR
jgi:hypothetical protein